MNFFRSLFQSHGYQPAPSRGDWDRPRPPHTGGGVQIRGLVETLTLQPGDLLIVKVDGRLTREQMVFLKDSFAKELPKGVKPIVIDGSMTLMKVSRQKSKRSRSAA